MLINVHCLMYADDIILLSKSAKGLQEKLDILNTYCKGWCLTVNTSKTKILILKMYSLIGRYLKKRFCYPISVFLTTPCNTSSCFMSTPRCFPFR
jgi:hypothetical protein